MAEHDIISERISGCVSTPGVLLAYSPIGGSKYRLTKGVRAEIPIDTIAVPVDMIALVVEIPTEIGPGLPIGPGCPKRYSSDSHRGWDKGECRQSPKKKYQVQPPSHRTLLW